MSVGTTAHLPDSRVSILVRLWERTAMGACPCVRAPVRACTTLARARATGETGTISLACWLLAAMPQASSQRSCANVHSRARVHSHVVHLCRPVRVLLT